jgi:hypothetical protein
MSCVASIAACFVGPMFAAFFNAIIISTALYAGGAVGLSSSHSSRAKENCPKAIVDICAAFLDVHLARALSLFSFTRVGPTVFAWSVVSELHPLYQDVLFDSATCDVDFVKGLRHECSTVGLDLLHWGPIDVTSAINRWHVAQEVRASIAEDPRSCPSSVQQHARTSGSSDMVPRKSMCSEAVFMPMSARPLGHISCCVFVWVAMAGPVLWAGILELRDTSDAAVSAMREWGMRNIWFSCVSLSRTLPASFPT